MQALIDRLYSPFFKDNGYRYIKTKKNVPGYHFTLDKDLGQGRYWIYPVNEWFAVTSITAKYSTVYTSNNFIPKSLGFALSNASNNKDWYGCVTNNKYQQIVQYNGERFVDLHVVPGDFITAKGIVLLPEFYKSHIEPLTHQSFEDIFKLIDALNNPGSELPKLWQLINSFSRLSYNNSCIDFILENRIRNIIELLLMNQEILTPTEIVKVNNSADSENLIHVQSYIEEHYSESIRIDGLINIAYMSRTKLQLLFKEKTGMTITDYIQQQRTRAAKKLLVTTDAPLSHIAEHVGYSCHSSFTEVFKAREGMTPSQFRKAFVLI